MAATINSNSNIILVNEPILKTRIDKTTDPLYWFVAEASTPTLTTAQVGWRCHMITVATMDVDLPRGADGKETDGFEFTSDEKATLTYGSSV